MFVWWAKEWRSTHCFSAPVGDSVPHELRAFCKWQRWGMQMGCRADVNGDSAEEGAELLLNADGEEHGVAEQLCPQRKQQ